MDNIIQGNPTKSFFITMITRDITTEDAILDLLDNSIDGANKINPREYRGLYIDIIINAKEFIVKDNCGGFSLDIAKNMHLGLDDRMMPHLQKVRLVDLVLV